MLAYDSAPGHQRDDPGQLAGLRRPISLHPGGVTGSKNIVITGNFFSTEIFAGCGYYGLNASHPLALRPR